MSLATRCTACSTVFRVVQDQLKVSEGWVRCGRCNEVFNALEGLFDLDRDAPAAVVGPALARPVEAADPDSPFGIDAPIDTSDPTLVDRIDSQLLGAHRIEPKATPAVRVTPRDRVDFPDARFDPESTPTGAPSDVESGLADWPADDSVAVVDADEPLAPDFMRRAQRQARWHSKRIRAALLTLTLLLVLALGLQAAHHFRDTIAVRWPETQPMLAAWCALAGCSLQAPQRIDDVSVESSALTRANAADDAFKLNVALRNRGGLTVALPWVDLSLTDASGQLVARRALGPRDFKAASALMPPGAESALQVVLTAGSARVTGYTVEIFYP